MMSALQCKAYEYAEVIWQSQPVPFQSNNPPPPPLGLALAAPPPPPPNSPPPSSSSSLSSSNSDCFLAAAGAARFGAGAGAGAGASSESSSKSPPPPPPEGALLGFCVHAKSFVNGHCSEALRNLGQAHLHHDHVVLVVIEQRRAPALRRWSRSRRGWRRLGAGAPAARWRLLGPLLGAPRGGVLDRRRSAGHLPQPPTVSELGSCQAALLSGGKRLSVTKSQSDPPSLLIRSLGKMV